MPYVNRVLNARSKLEKHERCVEWHEAQPSASLASRVLFQLPKCIQNSINVQLKHELIPLKHSSLRYWFNSKVSSYWGKLLRTSCYQFDLYLKLTVHICHLLIECVDEPISLSSNSQQRLCKNKFTETLALSKFEDMSVVMDDPSKLDWTFSRWRVISSCVSLSETYIEFHLSRETLRKLNWMAEWRQFNSFS